VGRRYALSFLWPSLRSRGVLGCGACVSGLNGVCHHLNFSDEGLLSTERHNLLLQSSELFIARRQLLGQRHRLVISFLSLLRFHVIFGAC